MNRKVLLVSLLCLSLSELTQLAWGRSVSVSLNMSLTRTEKDDPSTPSAAIESSKKKLNRDLLQSCMRETEISMSQLKLFRLSLLFNENTNSDTELGLAPGNGDDDMKNGNTLGEVDYGNNAQIPFLDLKRNEPLQCFVRCLYKGLGLIHYDMLLEEAFKMEIQNLMQRQKDNLLECHDIDSKNSCEAAYKLHLCYNHLKNLEAEQRLKDVLDRSGTATDPILPDNEDNENDTKDDKTNEVIDGMQQFDEQDTN